MEPAPRRRFTPIESPSLLAPPGPKHSLLPKGSHKRPQREMKPASRRQFVPIEPPSPVLASLEPENSALPEIPRDLSPIDSDDYYCPHCNKFQPLQILDTHPDTCHPVRSVLSIRPLIGSRGLISSHAPLAIEAASARTSGTRMSSTKREDGNEARAVKRRRFDRRGH